METLEIRTIDDVRCFFFYLISCKELGVAFHPDTMIQDYYTPNGDPAIWNGVLTKQLQLERCFEVCSKLGYDIYEEGLKIVQAMGLAPAPTPEKEDEGGQYNGNGFTFNLDTAEFLQEHGLDHMPDDMWEEIKDDVADRALQMMKEGYHQGELCISYCDDQYEGEFCGWWYSK